MFPSDIDATRIGVVIHDRSSQTEALLAAFAAELRARGIEVGGLVQRSADTGAGRTRMELVDVRTGDSFCISQDLGPGSQACAVDPEGMAEASQVLRREVERRVALLVVNKFAGLEAAGRGLSAELFRAVEEGVPVLTSVSVRYKDQWDAISGGLARELAPDIEALRAWWRLIAPEGDKA